jgi:hypothetical protein
MAEEHGLSGILIQTCSDHNEKKHNKFPFTFHFLFTSIQLSSAAFGDKNMTIACRSSEDKRVTALIDGAYPS